MFERTLVSLQAIAQARGKDSLQYRGAVVAIERLLDTAVQQLQAASNGRWASSSQLDRKYSCMPLMDQKIESALTI